MLRYLYYSTDLPQWNNFILFIFYLLYLADTLIAASDSQQLYLQQAMRWAMR